MYVYMRSYALHIYIYIERERERDTYMSIHTHTKACGLAVQVDAARERPGSAVGSLLMIRPVSITRFPL